MNLNARAYHRRMAPNVETTKAANSKSYYVCCYATFRVGVAINVISAPGALLLHSLRQIDRKILSSRFYSFNHNRNRDGGRINAAVIDFESEAVCPHKVRV
jgi:hypothetical protein